jgi:ribosome-binding protein aMBF1 (putative translation factor)
LTPHQYKSARRTLGWSYPELAEAIGKSERECYRYAAGAVEIPETVGKFIRRLVQDKLTLSERN